MTTIKSVEELLGFLEDARNVTGEPEHDILNQYRQHIQSVLVEALEGMKRRHYDENAFINHRNDFNDAYNYVIDDAITTINQAFDTAAN